MEFKGLINDDDVEITPLTVESLRKRLKHIAGLCWGLSIDLNNELERNQRLEAEVIQLRKKVSAFDKRMALREEKLSKLPPEEREKREEKLYKKRLQAVESRKRKAQREFKEGAKRNDG